jgi:hypothetical protein
MNWPISCRRYRLRGQRIVYDTTKPYPVQAPGREEAERYRVAREDASEEGYRADLPLVHEHAPG